jgi:uncharacterized protein with PhoU and TrkA domain
MVKIVVNFAAAARNFTNVARKVINFVYQKMNVHPIVKKLNQLVTYISAKRVENRDIVLMNG